MSILILIISLIFSLALSILFSYIKFRTIQKSLMNSSELGIRGKSKIELSSAKIIAYGILLYICMLIGMSANYFFFNRDVLDDFSHFKFSKFVLPIIISPIVFLTLWSQSKNLEKGITPLLIAFQNGFFWQTIFGETQ